MIGSLAPWSGSITKGVPLSLGSLALGLRENEFDTTSAPASPGFGPCTSQALFPRKRRQCGNEMEALFFFFLSLFSCLFFSSGFHDIYPLKFIFEPLPPPPSFCAYTIFCCLFKRPLPPFIYVLKPAFLLLVSRDLSYLSFLECKSRAGFIFMK